MTGWPLKPLLEVADLVTTRAHAFSGTRQYVSTGDVSGTKIVRSEPITFNERPLRADLSALEDDVLFARMQATDKVIVITNKTKENLWSTGFAALRPKSEIHPKWLSFWLRSKTFMDQKDAHCTGATQKAINNDGIRRLSIPLPPFSEQKRLLERLNEAESIIQLRDEAVTCALSIEVALFQKIFGAPTVNPFGWPIRSVGELFDKHRGGVKCGPFGSALKKDEYIESGVPVWGIPNVLHNHFIEEGSLFISREKFLELKSYSVESGDLLISRAGTVGRICVARPRVKESIIGTNLIRLSLDKTQILPDFFAALLTYFASDVGHLRADTSATSYSFMNTTVLKSLRIYLPPLRLQEFFVQKICELRELHDAQAISREQLDKLFQSLLHRAFQEKL